MIRELRQLASKPIYLFMMVIAPVFCFLLFADLFKDGVPVNLPIAVVDMDNTSVSRSLTRSLDAFQQTDIIMRTADFTEARKTMQKGKIYGIFYIPEHFGRDASSGKEPVLSFYTNDSYILPGSLLYKDMRLQSALANGAVQRALLQAKGATEPQLSARLNPVAVDAHPLNNPWLSYAIYLSNILMPAFLCMFSMFVVVYSFGDELKRGTAAGLMALGRYSIYRVLVGKLLPQLLIFGVVGCFCLSLLYRYLHFPLNSGFFPMFLAVLLLILASQGFALLMLCLYSRNRMALSSCALWAVLSFSISGFTFPVRSMAEPMQIFAQLFPMRHYFLLYVDQALNGIPMIYSWQSYTALIVFIFLPLPFLSRLKAQLRRNVYLP